MTEIDDDGPATITVCQGPPRCMLQGDAAAAAAQAGCQFCRRIIIDPDDGSERVIEPGNA